MQHQASPAVACPSCQTLGAMSYSYMFFRVTEGVGAPSDLSEETPLPIGAQREIWARLVSLFPNAFLEPSSHAGWLDPIELMGNITFHDKSNRSFSASRIERS